MDDIDIGEIIKSNIDYWRNLYIKEREENMELITRLRADSLIERDKYWINKIKH